MELELTAPAQSTEKGLPVMTGPGSASVRDGRLVIVGQVFGLSAWWMNGLVMALAFAALVPLMLLSDELFREPMPGVGVGLGGILLAVAADWWQQRQGRTYELVVPNPVAHRITVSHPDTPDATKRVHVLLYIDEWIVGDARRPPMVEFTCDGAHLRELQQVLAHR